MKNMSKKKKVLVGFIAALVLILGLFGLKMFLEQPRNLGPNLEYIGKRHTGCPLPLPLGYILLCSSEPGEEYYFGTDLSVEELRGYFGADFIANRQRLYPSVEKALESNHLSFRTIDNEVFVIYSYLDKNGVTDFAHLRQTEKKMLIGIGSADYKLAKKALNK